MEEFFRENPVAALAFSGGVDSSYLLYAGKKYGAKIKAYFIKTKFQPEFELEDAKKIAKQTKAEMVVLEKDILAENQIVSNPVNRCYYCKKFLFETLCKKAKEDGYNLVMDGTNASDNFNDRPGIKALNELSVRSPLHECGLTKDVIRKLSEDAGLFTWDKPSYSCLATRIPEGSPITEDLLERIEKAEGVLFKMGFLDFRLRVYNDAARLQVIPEMMQKVFEKRLEIVQELKPWFDIVLLDARARGEG